jgi:hypothetical protein
MSSSLVVPVDFGTISKLPLRSKDIVEVGFGIDEHLARYYYLMECAFKTLGLSEEEFLLMCSVLNGKMLKRECLDLVYDFLPTELEAFIDFEETDFDDVNLAVLQDKIIRSTLMQRFALIYKVDRYLLDNQ